MAFPPYYNYPYPALIFARSDQTTYGGSVSGAGPLIQQGPGNLILTGSSTYTQGTVFSGGTTSVGSDANLGAANGPLFFTNGALAFCAAATLSQMRNIYPNGQTATINTNGFNVEIDSQICPGSLTGNVTKTGAGTLTLTNIYNTYTGNPPLPGSTFTVNGGALAVGVNTAVPCLQLVLNGGALQATAQMGNTNPKVLNGSEFNTSIVIGPSGGTIDTGSNWLTTITPITGNVGCNITKIGTGTWYVAYGMGEGTATSPETSISWPAPWSIPLLV